MSEGVWHAPKGTDGRPGFPPNWNMRQREYQYKRKIQPVLIWCPLMNVGWNNENIWIRFYCWLRVVWSSADSLLCIRNNDKERGRHLYCFVHSQDLHTCHRCQSQVPTLSPSYSHSGWLEIRLSGSIIQDSIGFNYCPCRICGYFTYESALEPITW